MTPNVTSGPCTYLGRCDDADSHFGFPTIENCCHSGLRPFPVEPSYQMDNCLGEDWPECPRYKEALSKESTPKNAILAFAWRTFNQSVVPWEFVAISAVVLAILVGVWFLVLRPKQAPSQAGMTTPEAAATAPTTMRTPTQTPTETVSPTATSSRTPIPTASPTPTETPTHTPTPSPTATPSKTPSITPSLTPSLTAIPTTAVPTPSPTPTVTGTPLPVPKLLSPEDGQRFSANDKVVLRWQAGVALPTDGYYAVTVSFTHLGETWYDEIPWLETTNWTLSDHDYLVDLSDDGVFLWSVQVMLRTESDSNGKPSGVPISPSSETWSLIWQSAAGTPLPPPP